MVNRWRPVENDLLAAEKAANDHVFFKSFGWKCQEGVVAQRSGDFASRHSASLATRRQLQSGLRFAHAWFPGLGKAIYKRSGFLGPIPRIWPIALMQRPAAGMLGGSVRL